MPLSKWAKHLRFSNNLLLITRNSYLKKRILAMRFFFVNTAIRRLITILHYITPHYTTLLKQYLYFSETFPRHFRVNVVRISFACRLHLVRIMECNDNVRLLIL